MTNMIFDQNRPKHVLLSVQNIVTTDTIYFPLFLIKTNNRSNGKLLQPIKTEEFMTKKLVESFPIVVAAVGEKLVLGMMKPPETGN